MGKKTYLYLLGLLGFTSLTAAQVQTGEIGVVLGQILEPIFERYLGIPLSETNALSTLAVVGVFWYSLYLGLEAFLDKVGWLDRFVGKSGYGGSGSNRRLVGFSLLLFLVMLGSQVFTPLILLLRDSIILTLLLGALLLAWAGIKGTWFGSLGAITDAEASTKEYLADSKERLEKAEQRLGSAEQEEQESRQRAESGDTETADEEARDAAGKLEKAIQDIEQVIEDIEAIEGKDESEIKDILQKAKNAKMGGGLGAEKEFENRLKAVDQALQVMEGLSKAGRSAGDIETQLASGTKFSNFDDLESHIQALYSDLQTYANREGVEEGTVEDELEELIDVVQDFEKTHELLEGLSKEMQEARKAENFEEELAQQYGDEELYERVEMEERQVRKLGEKLDNLEQFHQNLESEIEEAIQIVNEHINLDKSELNELEQARENLLPDIESRLESTENALSSNPAFDPTTGGKDKQLAEILNSIDVSSLNDLMVQIEERMRGAEDSWRNRMNNLLNNFPP